MRRRLLALLLLGACPGAGTNTTLDTSTGPAHTSTGVQPTGGTTDACEGSGDCNTTGICVADYAAADTEPPAGMRDAAACVPKAECIGALDLGRWCFDHRGCCENLRCHPADGTCEPRGLGETTSSTGDASDSTATGSTGEGTGTGTDTSTGG